MRPTGSVLFVHDLDAMVRFYGDVLGREPEPASRSEQWAEFDCGGYAFGVHAIPDPEPLTSTDPREWTTLRLDFAVADVDREAKRLEAMGVRMLTKPWGARHFVDPEGNVFGLIPDERP